jgi:hypothetical protein
VDDGVALLAQGEAQSPATQSQGLKYKINKKYSFNADIKSKQV